MSGRAEKFTGWYNAAIAFSAFWFRTFMPVRYHDIQKAQLDAPYILICNHKSNLDPLVAGWKCHRYQIRYLGKKELTKFALLRKLFAGMRMIPVDRHHSDIGAVRTCLKTLKEGHALGVFPEGTRHKQGVMAKEDMESGVAMIALRANVPLLPVYISGKPRLFHIVDCYYGDPFTVGDIAERGVNKEACEETLERISALYRGMMKAHRENKNR